MQLESASLPGANAEREHELAVLEAMDHHVMSRATVVKDWLENNGISSSDIAAIESSGLLSTDGLFQEVTDTALNELLKVRHIQLNTTSPHPHEPTPTPTRTSRRQSAASQRVPRSSLGYKASGGISARSKETISCSLSR